MSTGDGKPSPILFLGSTPPGCYGTSVGNDLDTATKLTLDDRLAAEARRHWSAEEQKRSGWDCARRIHWESPANADPSPFAAVDFDPEYDGKRERRRKRRDLIDTQSGPC
jgi:hypothetical protein